MGELKKYYNLRFPKNGRFPTYLDMMSLYPSYGSVPKSWDDAVCISDADFEEHINVSGSTVTVKSNPNRVVVDIQNPPDDDQIYYYEANMSDQRPIVSIPDITVDKYVTYNTSLTKLSKFINNSLIGTSLKPGTNTFSDSSICAYGLIKDNAGNTYDAVDFVSPKTTDNNYNMVSVSGIGQDNRTKSCTVYFGAEASTGLYANRCFSTIVNPYTYSNKDIASQLKSNKQSLVYNILTLPQLAEKTLVDEMFINAENTIYTLSLTASMVNVIGPKEVSPGTISVSGSIQAQIGTAYVTKPLSKEYYLACSIYTSDDIEIGITNKYLDNDGQCVIDIVNDFPQVMSFLNSQYHITGRLYYNSTLIKDTVIEIFTKVDADYDSYQIRLVDENNLRVNQLGATKATTVLPTPLYIRVYGSNNYVTDQLVYDNSVSLTVEPVMKSGSTAQYINVNKIVGTRYELGDIYSKFATYVSNWFLVDSVNISLFKTGYGRMNQINVKVIDDSAVKDYFITSNLDNIHIINRNEISDSMLTVSLKGNLESGNIGSVSSVQHEIDMIMYNVENEIVGNTVYDRSFQTSDLTFDLYVDFINTIQWNWFEIDRIEILFTGENISNDTDRLIIKFEPAPDDSVYIDTDILPSVTEQTVMSDGSLVPDAMIVSYGIYMEDVYYPPTVGMFYMNFVLYSNLDDGIVTNTKIELDDTNIDNVDVVMTELFPNINWENIDRIGIYITNEGISPAGRYNEFYIPINIFDGEENENIEQDEKQQEESNED